MWLYAAPQKVGVTLKGAPTIQKALVNSDGETVEAAEETEFHFVIYKGDSIALDSCDTAAIGTALADKEFTYVTLTVNKGESLSGKLLLNPQTTQKWSYTGGAFAEGTEVWTWENGTQYTVVELAPESGEYAYGYINAAENTGRTYTFTYDQSENQAITVYNIRHDWSIALTKTSEGGTLLSGAVFGLYSWNENPDIVEKFASFGLRSDTATTYTASDGTVWYLSQIAVTGSDGTLAWDSLSEDRYLVLELKAPDGFIPSTEVLELTYTEARTSENPAYTVKRTVQNTAGYELPESGGPGTALFTAAGLMLMAAAMLLLVEGRKRRRKGAA